MSTPPVARSSAATPAATRGGDSFSDLASLDAEIGALAHDLGRGSADVRPLTSFVPSQSTWAPFRIGRYTAVERVGSGGMGVVYAAYDHELDRKVAIKIVRRVGDSDTDEATARMRREAQALAKVNHPNVLAVHEVGVHDESSTPSPGTDPIAAGRFVFIVTEFVVGKTLREWWTHAPRSWIEVRDAVVQAARGLAAAHGVGLVHRDVKPENAMIDADGRVRLMDFGLARARFDPQERTLDGEHSDPTTTPAMSRDGAMIGTPAYMAPEQLRGEDVGPAADQFALAVMAWEGLFGERPFAGAELTELVANVLDGRRREPPRSVSVPGFIRAALERALAIAPADQWPDVRTFANALAGDRRRRWWVVAAPIALVSAAVLAVPRGPDACTDRDAQLGGVWDDDVRSRVQAAMVATRAPYAADTFERIAPRLDRYADAWMTARRGHVRGRAQLHQGAGAVPAGPGDEGAHGRARAPDVRGDADGSRRHVPRDRAVRRSAAAHAGSGRKPRADDRRGSSRHRQRAARRRHHPSSAEALRSRERGVRTRARVARAERHDR